jgi:hypothetical protein
MHFQLSGVESMAVSKQTGKTQKDMPYRWNILAHDVLIGGHGLIGLKCRTDDKSAFLYGPTADH